MKDFFLFLAPRFPWLWWIVSKVPPLRWHVNRLFIDIATNCTEPRPHPFSLWGPLQSDTSADYVSWTGLVDRTFTGRHLPPAPKTYVESLPPPEQIAKLFVRGPSMVPCPKSSALFGFFAQWFTDSFLRTDPQDFRKNTSNHEIDLCQIYGLSAKDTSILRSRGGGELQSQRLAGEEYPPYLFEDDGACVKDQFRALSYIDKKTGTFLNPIVDPALDTPERRSKLFAMGLERGNSTIFYTAINTIFLREHNRLCRAIARRHPGWDDDRVFETARNTNITQLLKIIIENYINHLSTAHFRVFVDVGFAETQKWYRTNRIAAEFDLLYRWHPLIPERVNLRNQSRSAYEFLFNNGLLIDLGIEEVIAAAATQRAGRVMLKNTMKLLVDRADLPTLMKSRQWRVRPYNEYRKCFGLKPVTSFGELTGDPALAAELKTIYKDVNHVELLVGLFADRHEDNGVLGSLMRWMVAADAFSQALTNPLLSKNVYGEQAFSEVGIESINSTTSFDDIVRRNSSMGNRKATFSTAQPPPGRYGFFPFLKTFLDTVDFLFFSGWEEFFHRRQVKYGSTVFKVNLFQPTIAMLDHRAIKALFASTDLVPDGPSRGFQFELPPLPLVGNIPPSMYEAGPKHNDPKSLYIRIIQDRKSTLVSTFNSIAEEYTSRWLLLNQFSWRDGLEDFAVSFVFQWLLGIRPDTKAVRYLYNHIFTHYLAAVTKYIPGSSYRRSLAIYKRLLVLVKAAPRFGDIIGIAREIGLTDEDVIAKQITYVAGMNSFLGLQNLLKSVIGELSSDPKLRDELRQEMEESLVGGDVANINLGHLARLTLLDNTLREILRLHPPVFLISGRATQERFIESDSGTFKIGKGELVMGVIPFAHHDPSVFPRPEQFDPHRFEDQAAREHLIWPRGLHDGEISPDNRTCPGKDLAVLVAKLFCFAILTKFDWRLRDPRPGWDTRQFSLNVAAPKGPLDVESFHLRETINPRLTLS